jgi:hypothetical protein
MSPAHHSAARRSDVARPRPMPPPPPMSRCLAPSPQPLGDLAVAQPGGRQQHDTCALGQLLRRGMRTDERAQRLLMLRRQFDRFSFGPRHGLLPSERKPSPSVMLFPISPLGCGKPICSRCCESDSPGPSRLATFGGAYKSSESLNLLNDIEQQTDPPSHALPRGTAALLARRIPAFPLRRALCGPRDTVL